MSERSVQHETFVIERTYDAPPDRVFAAWSEPEAKAAWFGDGAEEYELDFRAGGREMSRGAFDGEPYLYECRYHDIVPGERIVYVYDMYLRDTRISVSLGTVELHAAGAGTRLVYTEQATFLDGLDTAEQRRSGTEGLLDALGEVLG